MSNDFKNALNIYLAFAASNKALPLPVAFFPAAPIITLNCSMASGELDAKTSLSIVSKILSLGKPSLPKIPFTPLFVNKVESNFLNLVAIGAF